MKPKIAIDANRLRNYDVIKAEAWRRKWRLGRLKAQDMADLFERLGDLTDEGIKAIKWEIRAGMWEMPQALEYEDQCALDDEIGEWWKYRDRCKKGRDTCRRKLAGLLKKTGLTLGAERLIREIEWHGKTHAALGLPAKSKKALSELPRTPAVARILEKHRHHAKTGMVPPGRKAWRMKDWLVRFPTQLELVKELRREERRP